MNKLCNSELIRYILTGGMTTAVNYGLFFLLNAFSVNYLLSNSIAWLGAVLFAFYVVAVALVLGFCFGWRFHFAGPELGSRQVNDVMDQIDDAAEDIRERVRRSWRDRKK